jgi:alanine-synthesizing transaminase
MPATASVIRTAKRVDRFTYAIRNIVAEAKKVEATGKKVRYLNIGDPNQFGFLTPPHLIEAVIKAMRDGHNGYVPSPGIVDAREAAAADFVSRGVNVSADRVLITSGTSEGIELALTAIVDEGEQVLVPSPTYPLYTAVLAKIGAQPSYYKTDHTNNWQPDLDHIKSLINPKTRALVVIDPNNPTGAIYPDATRRALIEIAETHGLVILADEVYGDLSYDGPVPSMAALNNDAPIMDGGGRITAARPGPRRHQEACRRPPVQPGADAIRGHRCVDGRSIAPGGVPRTAARPRRADDHAHERDSGHVVRDAEERVLRDAESRAPAG